VLNIYFCFPYRGVGGVSLLFLRVAEWMAKKGIAHCHLIDYADGFMAKHLREPGVKLEVYRDEGPKVRIPADAIAVFQSMTPWSIFPGIAPDAATRVFFWNCYPFNLIPLAPGFRRQMQRSDSFARLVLATVLRGYRRKMRKLTYLLLSRSSLAFMDRTNLRTTERYLGLKVAAPTYLPIPLPVRPADASLAPSRELVGEIRVAWVGRVVDFKFYTLHRALEELDRLQPWLGVRIAVTIVGSGDYREQLANAAADLGRLDVRFIDHVDPQELDCFLLAHVDLMIAMGTAALEGARLGIPTLLLDVAHGPVSRDYVFTWLHERQGFTLGDVVGSEHFVPGNDSLARRLRELITDFASVSRQARDYVASNHAMPRVADALTQALIRAHCTYGDLAQADLLGRGFLYSAFSRLKRKFGLI
jgi:glycosyltransferase involved in cell wall biosynthesis